MSQKNKMCLSCVLLLLSVSLWAGCHQTADEDDGVDVTSDTADTQSDTPTDSGSTVGREPLTHRPDAQSCENVYAPAEPPDSASADMSNCSSHADCTAGDNGKCVGGIGMAWNTYFCTYDTCKTDADCGDGGVCYCTGQSAARCVNGGNCQVDGDCGPNGYCSPFYSDNCGGYLTIGGYQCHTTDDICTDDKDCNDDEYCNFNAYNDRWECMPLDNGCIIG